MRRKRKGISSYGTTTGHHSRGPTPPRTVRIESIGKNMDLAEVHPTPVVVGSALAIRKKELNRKVNQH